MCGAAYDHNIPDNIAPPESRFLPEDVRIYGFARSEMTDDALRERITGFLKGHDDKKAGFLERLTYVHGTSCGVAGWNHVRL